MSGPAAGAAGPAGAMSARAAAITAVRELVAAQGRQGYRLQIADVEWIVNPGLGPDSELLLGDLERLIPAT